MKLPSSQAGRVFFLAGTKDMGLRFYQLMRIDRIILVVWLGKPIEKDRHLPTLEDLIVDEIAREDSLGARRVNALQLAEKVSPTGDQQDAGAAAVAACEVLEAEGKLVSYMRIETYLRGVQPERWRYHYRFIR